MMKRGFTLFVRPTQLALRCPDASSSSVSMVPSLFSASSAMSLSSPSSSPVGARKLLRRASPWSPSTAAHPAFQRHYNTLPWGGDQHLPRTGSAGWHATTILCVRKGTDVVVIGDGQVSLGNTVMKPNAKKVRTIDGGKVITGFAGATADCFTLLQRLEQQLEEHPGQLLRAGVEVAKAWRTDKYLRNLEALLIACDKDISLVITGNGDVVEPHDGLIGIGSGGTYALAAARALIDVPNMSALEIAKKSMDVASDICVFTNKNYVIETLKTDGAAAAENSLSSNPSRTV